MALRRALRDFLRRDDGPTALEYAVLLATIVLAIYSSVQLFGGSSDGLWSKNVNTLNNEAFPK